ncbi:MAG: DUF2189 domain-containing protein [gamma proteobacterium endosymbiont of Lamellibrachia anaximandri]|nr:DUF2189 domain-containing protein [gamma proteobacterium endosymbiont of Lamellibrachia anaximandri]
MNHAVIHHYDARPVTIAQVREITTDHVWKWLAAGWEDIKAAPAKSLSYGLGLTVISYLLTLSVIASGMYFLFPQVLAGFFLTAPLLGIGLYQISRQLEKGETPTLKNTLLVVKSNSFNLLTMGVILVVALIAWVTVAQLVVALTFTGITPATWQGFISALFGTWEGAQLLLVGASSGAVIAFIIFGISAITVPMLIDRSCNVFDAIHTSWNAVRYNILPMMFWAGILVAIITVGFLTLYVGLVIGFPLAAHATWHAYRDLVEKE